MFALQYSAIRTIIVWRLVSTSQPLSLLKDSLKCAARCNWPCSQVGVASASAPTAFPLFMTTEEGHWGGYEGAPCKVCVKKADDGVLLLQQSTYCGGRLLNPDPFLGSMESSVLKLRICPQVAASPESAAHLLPWLSMGGKSSNPTWFASLLSSVHPTIDFLFFELTECDTPSNNYFHVLLAMKIQCCHLNHDCFSG